MKDHYKTLEVERSASTSIIKEAFRRLSRLFHPDKFSHGSSEAKRAEIRFKDISEAYHVLKDPERRRLYDLELKTKQAFFESAEPQNTEPQHDAPEPEEPVSDRPWEEISFQERKKARQMLYGIGKKDDAPEDKDEDRGRERKRRHYRDRDRGDDFGMER